MKKYVIKKQDGTLEYAFSHDSLASTSEFEVLGLASDINPNDYDLSKYSWSLVEISPEQQLIADPEQQILIKEATETEPAEYQIIPARYVTIPAITQFQLIEDSNKVTSIRQDKANANLDKVRSLRQPLLDEADCLINTLEDDGEDATSYRLYRKALRDCTNSYKKVNGEAKLLCENLIAEEFDFPGKP